MAPKKHFLIILSFLLLIKLCVSSPVTNPNKTEIVVPEMPEMPEMPKMPEMPEMPEMPDNLCALPPYLGYSG